MIVPKQDYEIANIYQCGACDGFFSGQTGSMRISCLVAHAPGSCCHYGEKSITQEQINGIREILNADSGTSTD